MPGIICSHQVPLKPAVVERFNKFNGCLGNAKRVGVITN